MPVACIRLTRPDKLTVTSGCSPTTPSAGRFAGVAAALNIAQDLETQKAAPLGQIFQSLPGFLNRIRHELINFPRSVKRITRAALRQCLTPAQ
jgi:hypothetical protein